MQGVKWIETILNSVADRGREILGMHESDRADSLPQLCRQLIAGRGEASNVALAREILRGYAALDATGRTGFLETLARDFGPDVERIRLAADAYRPDSPASLVRLLATVEPPRQELFRRLNMAPRGTAALVSMRADLLQYEAEQPLLQAAESDLKHLLISWFNRGFLRLQRIDWRSPAVVLEKLIRYEAVHEINGWDDLHRRLAEDRRCFGFFHPALPDDPLIFVEVALTDGIATDIDELIGPDTPLGDPEQADTAMFYSINNSLPGLRGISFGNFLLKQVIEELAGEFPGLKRFVTLSPMPRFATTLRHLLDGREPGWPPAELNRSLDDQTAALREATGAATPVEAVRHLLENPATADRAVLGRALQRLALLYLAELRHDGRCLDPVAGFHLANGAILERINPFSDRSGRGLSQSHGTMVNYLYDPEQLIANHEAFVAAGRIAMARTLQREYARHIAIDH